MDAKEREMKERESHRVEELVLLKESHDLSYRETCQLHGVSIRTGKYAESWCRRMHPRAEAFVSGKNLSALRSYRRMILRDIRESLSLQESCARHGCPASTYRMWEYAYYSGLMDARESELTGRPLEKAPIMGKTEKSIKSLEGLSSSAGLEKALEAMRAENEYLRCENAYLKKKMELEGRPVTAPDFRRGRVK